VISRKARDPRSKRFEQLVSDLLGPGSALAAGFGLVTAGTNRSRKGLLARLIWRRLGGY
jgi:hypothetical protein